MTKKIKLFFNVSLRTVRIITFSKSIFNDCTTPSSMIVLHFFEALKSLLICDQEDKAIF